MSQEPIQITGVWLRREGQDMVVDVELPGRGWVEAIREHMGPVEWGASHIVEPAGIRGAGPATHSPHYPSQMA